MRRVSQPKSHFLRALAAIALLGAVSCNGSIGEPAEGENETTGGGPTGGPNGNGSVSPADAVALGNGWPAFEPSKAFQLRRLTNEQYAASVQTLLGISVQGMPAIEPVPSVAGFSAIGASSVSVSGTGVGQFENAARFLAQAALAPTGQRQKIVGCTPTGVADTACFKSFITSFGQKAFRRPLTADEITRYSALTSQVATATADAWQGLEATLSAFLQSPNFLYMAEVGAPDAQKPGRYRFSDYEMASRLSYFLTNNTPDDALMSAATSGMLTTTEGLQAHAARLLALPSAHDAVRAFFTSLLSLDTLDKLTRPVELFPKFTPTLGAALRQETQLVLDDLVFARDGDYRHLFDQQETFVNGELASLYGVPAPGGAGFARASLPAGSPRLGLLGEGGVLAARDHADGTSPTRRGLFVLTRLLCLNLPLMPPADLEIPAPPTGLLTAKQKLEMHMTNPVCASCHKQTDPVGFSLERFDAMGVYRETDHGLPIDDAGQIGAIKFQGLAGLGGALRDHPALEPCLIQSLYSVAVGHLATEFDHDTFSSMVTQFDASGARIRALLASMVASDGFRYLPAPTGQ